MNQEKIGSFIVQKEKEKGITQVQLAQKLGITDKSVSKWECGKCLPDASLYAALCAELIYLPTNYLPDRTWTTGKKSSI